MVRNLFGLYREETNLKAESSFSKTFEHNNSRDNILSITVTLKPLYNNNIPSSISTKTPLLKPVVPSAF